jgi:hypothetical protein
MGLIDKNGGPGLCIPSLFHRAVVPESPEQHLLNQQIMTNRQTPERPAPAERLRMSGIPSRLIVDDRKKGMQFPMFTEEAFII